MAPEITYKRDYDGRAVDMWALGVLLFVMLTGTFPFKGTNESDLYHKIQKGNFVIPEYVSKDAKRVIHQLLELNQTRRIRASELIKDPWVTCHDLPLSAYESVSSYHRNQSNDARSRVLDKENIADLHNRAVD